ncbi:MAG: hypothetical protein NTU43_10880 [Bacteroidetes bacterium]|nr:hypothetical protein [Bacteroidota bacterium]
MKKYFTIFICIICSLYASAQEELTNTTPLANSENQNLGSANWGVSVNLTTNGIGAEVSRSLTQNQKFVARLGGCYLAYDLNNYAYNNGSKAKPQYLIANANIVLGSIGAYVDWYPFGNAFKLTGGIAYMISNVKSTAQLRDSTLQGVIQISPDEVGQIKAEIKPSSIVAPYIGIGIGRAIPKHRVGVSFDIGTYYIGSPDLTFNTTKMLAPTSSQAEVLRGNLSDYQWLPKLSFNINIKLTK